MKAVQYTPPTIEPVSLAELKLHLRLDSGSFVDNIDEVQSIAPGNHSTTVGYALLGSSVEVIGKNAVVVFSSGENGATGTVDVKIQDSDNGTTWTDWAGGAFTQVTTATDNATFEKEYTGVKRYIRVVAQVLLAACDFGVSIVRLNPTSAEDSLLSAIIQSARECVEDITGRQLLTATWDFFQKDWPSTNAIKLPFGNLQDVTSVSWKDTDGIETTLTEITDYLIETNGDQCGSVVLPYGVSWPSGTLYPSNPIKFRFDCGWESAAEVPSKIKAAILMICADLYENRESQIISATMQPYAENVTVQRLLASSRLWDQF
jgi:uncharacterized phiE125 gp8 family phage protein